MAIELFLLWSYWKQTYATSSFLGSNLTNSTGATPSNKLDKSSPFKSGWIFLTLRIGLDLEIAVTSLGTELDGLGLSFLLPCGPFGL